MVLFYIAVDQYAPCCFTSSADDQDLCMQLLLWAETSRWLRYFPVLNPTNCLHTRHIHQSYSASRMHTDIAPPIRSQTHLHPSAVSFLCLAYTSVTLLHIHAFTHHVLYQTHRHTKMHLHTQILKFCQSGSCVEYRAIVPDLKASPLLQMCHQLALPLALPLLPYSLPLSQTLSSAEPIFWHFKRCSSHSCHLSPPPLTLSSQLSIASMRLCLKLMYFVELTLWRLHHLEVGKWYWAEGPILSVWRKRSCETFSVSVAWSAGSYHTIEGEGSCYFTCVPSLPYNFEQDALKMVEG